MEILTHEYNEFTSLLYVEFTTNEDPDIFRTGSYSFEEVQLYSPTIINEPEELMDIDKDFVKEFLESYFIENELPEESFF